MVVNQKTSNACYTSPWSDRGCLSVAPDGRATFAWTPCSGEGYHDYNYEHDQHFKTNETKGVWLHVPAAIDNDQTKKNFNPFNCGKAAPSPAAESCSSCESEEELNKKPSQKMLRAKARREANRRKGYDWSDEEISSAVDAGQRLPRCRRLQKQICVALLTKISQCLSDHQEITPELIRPYLAPFVQTEHRLIGALQDAIHVMRGNQITVRKTINRFVHDKMYVRKEFGHLIGDDVATSPLVKAIAIYFSMVNNKNFELVSPPFAFAEIGDLSAEMIIRPLEYAKVHNTLVQTPDITPYRPVFYQCPPTPMWTYGGGWTFVAGTSTGYWATA